MPTPDEIRRFTPETKKKPAQPVADYSQAPDQPKNYRLSKWYGDYLGSEQRTKNVERNPISDTAVRSGNMFREMRGQEPLIPATGAIPQQNYDTGYDPNQEWDYRTSSLNRDGDPLPKGAEGWTPSGEAWYGGGIVGTFKKIASIWNYAIDVDRPGSDEYEAKQKKLEEAEGLWAKSKIVVANSDIVSMGRLVGNAALLPLNFLEEVIGRPFTTASMVMEDMAQDSTWKPISTKITEWLPGKTETFFQRASPIRNVYNMVRVVQAGLSGNAIDRTFDERIELWKSNFAASKMGWSIGAGEQQFKAEFFARVSEGEHR
ncbi:MAG: hypothetical protein KAH23_10165, partial [Kiritimatiellae bacterium]|nr:hypothetical protein [Kiritimatiellia bacterium]